MFSFDLSGRASSRFEGVNVSGIFTCPVPTTSAEREEVKSSLRGNADTPLPPGPQITMVSGSSSENASAFGYGGGTLLGLGAQGDAERGAKSGGNQSQEGERDAVNAQAVKRHSASASQLQDSEQQPQIYPWMTKLHMSHGKVCPLFFLPKVWLKCFPLVSLCAATLLFARSGFPLEFYRPNAGNNKNSWS